MLEIRRQNANLKASKNNAGMAGSRVRAKGRVVHFLAQKWAEVERGISNHVTCCLGISPGQSAPLRHRLSI
jgi:hypothetical protein